MPDPRRRDAVLEALTQFKRHCASGTLNQLIVFLYVCENEGLNIADLAAVAGLSQSTASRSARALGPGTSDWSLDPALGLIEAQLDAGDQRSHVLRLTERGQALRISLNEIIARAQPISGRDPEKVHAPSAC